MTLVEIKSKSGAIQEIEAELYEISDGGWLVLYDTHEEIVGIFRDWVTYLPKEPLKRIDRS